MNPEFNKLVETGKLIVFPKGKDLVEKELAVAKSDLLDAKAGFDAGRFKWSTIEGYYSMFHAARALIYSKSYRERSHYAVTIALKTLFVEECLLDIRYVRDLMNAMNLREAADYQAEFSQEGSEAVIKAAGDFIKTAARILKLE